MQGISTSSAHLVRWADSECLDRILDPFMMGVCCAECSAPPPIHKFQD